MDIPTITDISPTNLLNLDERVAYDHFFGKTLSEARNLFSQNNTMYADDLVWMGRPAFEYYINAYVDYLREADCNNVDIYVPMSVVIGRYNFDDDFLGVILLIETISDIILKCGDLIYDSFIRDYNNIAQKILQKK